MSASKSELALALRALVEEIIAEDIPRMDCADTTGEPHVAVTFGYVGGVESATVMVEGLPTTIVVSDDLTACEQIAALCRRIEADFISKRRPAGAPMPEEAAVQVSRDGELPAELVDEMARRGLKVQLQQLEERVDRILARVEQAEDEEG